MEKRWSEVWSSRGNLWSDKDRGDEGKEVHSVEEMCPSTRGCRVTRPSRTPNLETIYLLMNGFCLEAQTGGLQLGFCFLSFAVSPLDGKSKDATSQDFCVCRCETSRITLTETSMSCPALDTGGRHSVLQV